jgi:SAM-dependent methyltransferase
MRLFAQIYYLLLKRMNYQRFNTAGKFDTLYSLDDDPFNVSDSEYERSKFADILEVLGGRRFTHTLDLGCGPGFMTAKFAPYSRRITSIDFSQKAIELARENCRNCTHVEFIQQDITTFRSPEKYDLLFCSEVLYYLDDDGFSRLLRNIADMAAEKAELVVTCRLDDERVRKRLEETFTLKRSKASEEWLRPYAIYLFDVNPSIS